MGSRLGERLKSDTLINQYQLEYAEQWVERSGGALIDAVIELRLVNEAALLRHLATLEKTRYVSSEKLSKIKIPSLVLGLVPAESARKHTLCPIMHDAKAGVLTVVAQTPFPKGAVAELAASNPGLSIQLYVGLPSAVRATVLKHYENNIDSFREIDQRLNDDVAGFLRAYAAAVGEAQIAADPFVLPGAPESLSAEIVPPPSSDPALSQILGLPSLPPLPSVPGASAAPSAAADPSRPPVNAQSAPAPSAPPAHAVSGVASAVRLAEGVDLLALLDVMTGAMEMKRSQLRGHGSTVARLSAHVAERLGLNEEEIKNVMIAAYLHDLGKKEDAHLTLLSIDDSEALADVAREQYAVPARLVSSVKFPDNVLQILNHLFERYDGSGFPEGLVGGQIPAGARIIAVVDAYEDLNDNAENYMGGAQEVGAALETLRMHGDLLFDPRVIEAVANILMTEGLRKKLLAASPWVLIVDKKLDDTSVLEFKLTQKGYNVVVSRDSTAAEKRLAERDFDLFICEVDTTPKDGFALLKMLRQNPRYAQTPFFYYSKVTDSNAVQRGFDLGASDWITKPFNADVFAAKIKRSLDERPREAGPKKDRGVAGSLSEMALPDMLQLLSQSRKSGQLVLRSNGREGEIYLEAGRVIDAIYGGLRGNEAFYQMIGWEEGEFKLDPDFLMMGTGTISMGTEGLLMEGLRRLDESRR